MMLDFIRDTVITTVNTRVKVYTKPSGKVAYLKSLIIVNKAAALATVEVYSGSDTDAGNYRLLTITVATNETKVLDRDVLEGFKAIHNIYVLTDQQPIRVSGTIELR